MTASRYLLGWKNQHWNWTKSMDRPRSYPGLHQVLSFKILWWMNKLLYILMWLARSIIFCTIVWISGEWLLIGCKEILLWGVIKEEARLKNLKVHFSIDEEGWTIVISIKPYLLELFYFKFTCKALLASHIYQCHAQGS